MLAHQRQTIRKGRFRLLIPGGGQNRDLSVPLELAGKDCDQRKQPQQDGRSRTSEVLLRAGGESPRRRRFDRKRVFGETELERRDVTKSERITWDRI
jgi:hypothetical protein